MNLGKQLSQYLNKIGEQTVCFCPNHINNVGGVCTSPI